MTALEDLRTLTVPEVADLLGVQPATVRAYVRGGLLEAMRWGGRLRVTVQAVRNFQASCRVDAVRPAEAIRRLSVKRAAHA